jgi:hypothetical protein
MASLKEAYRRPGTGSLFWCGYSDPEPIGVVRELLEVARAAGRTAYYVSSAGFDDRLTRLALYNLRGDRLAAARTILSAGSLAKGARRVAFAVEPRPTVAVVKGNAIRVEVPTDLLEATATLRITGSWEWLREQTRSKPVVAVPLRGKVLAIGTADGVRDVFHGILKGPVTRSPIVRNDLTLEDGAVTC